ncbi:MAG: metal ABC transporter ATP-binding protein [Candidatus Abyssobacteria bacterium SURF_17]|uniref:Metal ABC transporter ATP-binding protein n=1 Tax=Candidatus Abyssobacteria bacterium SURF_17 TaxID=2093361 RepID=A0A419EWU8_9BACT|nr:MAG: metal ABC transporter ATP-binding protein [Candidatus Abyssubacteria bacterium SURF_17]
MGDDKILEIRNLTVRYNEHVILNELNFYVNTGEIVAIIGPNGSGKTTLLKAILGLIPYKGEVRIFGGPPRLALKEIGYVPQRLDFDKTFPLMVKEFLGFVKVTNRPWREEVLREAGVNALMEKRLGELSGGQLQRLLIARAMLKEPRLLLLDEATSGVDVAAEMTFFELIEHVNKTHGVTVMLISHEVNMVYKFATQILCLNKDLVCNGRPKEAITQEVLEKLYGKNIQFQPHEH